MTDKKIIKAAVIGHPVSHSKSPLIHNYWIEKYGLNATYGTRDIAPENLQPEIKKLIEEDFAGFNVTIPHKESIFELCDVLDERAKKAAAVNTVQIKDGKLYGTNTDIFGFTHNILQKADENIFSGPCGIIGAGGAARAAIIALVEQGAPEIRITNRTKERAENLKNVAPDKIEIIDWEKRSEMLDGLSLLVNTTSLGMKGQPPLDISLNALPKTAAVCDIVYAPLYTPLLRQAEERGNTVITGIGMLLHQARPAFESWFGVLPDMDGALQNLVLA